MYLKKVEIKQFRQENIDVIWELNPDVNIIVGVNGCGKTTLLKSMSECFNHPTDIYVNDVTLWGKEPPVIFPYKANYTTTHKHFTNLIFYGIEEKIQQNYINTFDVAINDYITDLWGRLLSNSKVNHATPPMPHLSILDLYLEELEHNYRDFQAQLRQSLDKFYFGKKQMTEVEIKKMEEGLQTNHQRREIFVSIVNELFADTHKTFNPDDFKFHLENQKEIEFYELSAGEKQLLLILLTAFVQNHAPSIMLLDEPEISMHTYWQRALLKHIRTINPHCQLIVATHSPAIISKGWMHHFKRWEEIAFPHTEITQTEKVEV